jgi:hypothetical protein
MHYAIIQEVNSLGLFRRRLLVHSFVNNCALSSLESASLDENCITSAYPCSPRLDRRPGAGETDGTIEHLRVLYWSTPPASRLLLSYLTR